MTDIFIHIWNQLVLCTQFDVYGELDDFFKPILKQISEARDGRKITDRQFLVLINATREWSDILAKQRKQALAGKEKESAC